MRIRALTALVGSLAMVGFVPAAASAGAVRPQTCNPYPLGYAITDNSTAISVTISYPCAGEGKTWLVLERSNGSGGWNYVTDDDSPGPGIYYACHGTTTYTYELLPLFNTASGAWTTDYFTDNCG